MGLGRFALELRVELHREEERVGWEFNDFDEPSVGTQPRESHSVCFVLASVHIIEFIAMAVSFGNQFGSLVGFLSGGVSYQTAGLSTESHGAAELSDIALFVE